MPIQAPQWTEFLTCPICYNEFDEHSRQPISLGCGHTLCDSCLSNLPRTQCPFDQAIVETDVKKFPFNYALLQLVGVEIPDDKLPAIQCVQDNPTQYREAKHCIEELALFLRPVSGSTGYVNGNSNGVGSNGSLNGNGNNVLTRPMQRKLVTLVNCQLAESEGRTRAMRAARSLGERTVTELILLHQNQQQLSTNLWSAVRNRGCQFLGPAMQEEALKLILLALEGGEALSRKVLVLFVVQKLEPVFSQASKTSIGHVVQLLYRASCFKVTKRDDESSLMQLKESFRTYDALRKEHDAQIVQIATEAGLRILPDQWSSLLYGDLDHKSHMQSIIDKLQSPTSFSQSIQELIIALQRSGDPGNLSSLRQHFELLSIIDASPDAKCPEWDALEEAMKGVHSVVHGLVNFQRVYGNKMRGSNDPPQPHNNKFKTSMCRDFQRGGCPRGVNCTFAHSEEELERYSRRRSRPRPLATRGLSSSVSGAGPDQYSPQAPIENGSDSNPTATQALASCVNGSARSSPQFTTAGPVDVSSTACYGPPPQYNRRGSQEQMLSQRMKQMSIQASPASYQAEGGYCPPRSPYEHIPSPYSTPSGGDSRFYATYYGQSASPGNSYSSVVPRGEGKNTSAVLPPSMTPPRNSPLTVQEDGMNGLTNGHIDHLSARLDHPHSLYKNIPRPRRDMAPMLQQSPPPGATNYPFDLQYSGTFTSDPTHLYSHTDFFNHHYNARPAASYEHIPHGAVGYHIPTGGPRRDMSFPGPDYYNPRTYYYDQRDVYPAEMNGRLLMRGESGAVKRSPYIPDIMDDFKTSDSSSPRSSDTCDDNTLTDKMSPAADCELLDHWLGYTMCRKDTTLSSASSGVSSGSPLSHSPAASQSSNSSLSPRQQSPVGWQHGSDTEYIWRSFPDDSNTFPPPSALTDTVPIWRRGNEVSRLWGPLINMDEWARNDEQIKKDEQLARCLQEIEQSGSTPPTDTNSCNLTLQGLDTEDQQSSDQVRRGQDGSDRLLEEEEAERKRRKREEHQRLLQERRKLLRKQEKEKQERDDRKLAEEIAFRDAQQAGLVPPDPRCIMKPFNPNVISRAPPVGLGFINSEEDISGGCDPFGELKTFRGSCASSLSSNDDVIDSSKMTSGCAGDIRVQE